MRIQKTLQHRTDVGTVSWSKSFPWSEASSSDEKELKQLKRCNRMDGQILLADSGTVNAIRLE